MKKIITFIILLGFLAIGSISCGKKDKDNNDALLLFYLLSNSGKQSSQQTQATQVSSAASAVVSGITSAATSGSISGKFNPKKPEQMYALLNKRIQLELAKKRVPTFLPTALTKSSGSCTTTTCNAVLNGTANCSSGGTFTLTNMTLAMTFSSMTYSGTMSGAMSLSKCAATGTDYFDYPKLVGGTSSGDLTTSGTFGVSYSNLTGTTTSFSATVTFSDDNTINSTAGLTINGKATGAIKDLKTKSNLTILVSGTNIKSTTTTSGTTSTFTYSGDYADTVTGTVSMSGTVGGSSVNQSKTYSAQKFTYKLNCTGTMTADSFTFDCTVN